jgi:hypothetical protein
MQKEELSDSRNRQAAETREAQNEGQIWQRGLSRRHSGAATFEPVLAAGCCAFPAPLCSVVFSARFGKTDSGFQVQRKKSELTLLETAVPAHESSP